MTTGEGGRGIIIKKKYDVIEWKRWYNEALENCGWDKRSGIMSLYAIGDFHLSFSVDKPMDVLMAVVSEFLRLTRVHTILHGGQKWTTFQPKQS